MAQVKLERVSKIFDKDVIAVNEIDVEIKDKEFMGISKDTLFVCLDKSLSDSDKTNLSLTFQLKTI